MSVNARGRSAPDADARDRRNPQLQWIVDIYVLIAGVVLFAGALADRFGRRRSLLAGLSVYASAATAGSFADTANQVIAARADFSTELKTFVDERVGHDGYGSTSEY